MNLEACDICKLLPSGDPIFETKYWEVNIAQDQGYLGRSYVTLKEHKGDLAELTTEEWLDYVEIVKKFENALRLAFGAVVFNWGCLMNNAFQVNPALPHVHWHVRPRYDKSVTFEDIEFEDPYFGYHYDSDQVLKVEPELLKKIQIKIQENL